MKTFLDYIVTAIVVIYLAIRGLFTKFKYN